jgi:hypothetical protein
MPLEAQMLNHIPGKERLENGWKIHTVTLDKFLLDLVRNGSRLIML